MAGSTSHPADDEAEVSEIEVSAVDGAGPSQPPRPLPGPQTPPSRSRRARLLSICGAAVLVLLVITLGVPQVRGTLDQRLTAQPTPTVRAPLAPGPTPVLVPSLPAPALAAAPTTCPRPPALTVATVPFFGPAIGQSPVYLSGLSTPDLAASPRVTPVVYTAYGWEVMLLWAVEPGYTQPVTLHALRLIDGQPLSLSVGFFQAPALAATLDPNATSDSAQGAHWNTWFGSLFVPGAGCYALQAAWAGGSWQIPFAVGR
jgi:hypothetical protein